jgi:hypothetical protein
MSLSDRLRIERAVQSYDWWLSWHNTGGRRRRELRRELRANLVAAAAEPGGARAAVTALGDIRQLATETLAADQPSSQWPGAVGKAFAALFVALFPEGVSALGWLQGAEAAGALEGPSVVGSLTFFPGSVVSFVHEGTYHSSGWQPGWLCLLVGALVFVVALRPWRVLARAPR